MPGNGTTVPSTVSDLAAALNASNNTTRVQVFPTGDRLELQSIDANAPGTNLTLTATTTAGPSGQVTTLLAPRGQPSSTMPRGADDCPMHL